MELSLNILWVMISLGALGVWRIVWKRQPRQFSRTPLQQWTAIACALVFVFFAVSLSDDLQAATILADDCASGRHHSMVWNCCHGPHGDASASRAPFAAAARPGIRFPEPVQVFGRIAPAAFVFSGDASYGAIALRGPPIILL
jgi:hypothetical protein